MSPPPRTRTGPRRVVPSSRARPAAHDMAPYPLAASLAAILADVRYPALAWELVAHADAYGADSATRVRLADLAPGPYDHLRAVLNAIDALPGKT
jgi:hypothetical protein